MTDHRLRTPRTSAAGRRAPRRARGAAAAPVPAEGGRRAHRGPSRPEVGARRDAQLRLLDAVTLTSFVPQSAAARRPLRSAPSIRPCHSPAVCSPANAIGPTVRASASSSSGDESERAEYAPPGQVARTGSASAYGKIGPEQADRSRPVLRPVRDVEARRARRWFRRTTRRRASRAPSTSRSGREPRASRSARPRARAAGRASPPRRSEPRRAHAASTRAAAGRTRPRAPASRRRTRRPTRRRR